MRRYYTFLLIGFIFSFSACGGLGDDNGTAGPLSPLFFPDKTAYNLEVANSTESIDISPSAADDDSKITVNNQIISSGDKLSSTLKEGQNLVTVNVTAKDGFTVKTYNISINRLAGHK
jgi:hypothetical protein